MLIFKDLNFVEHVVNLNNINNIVFDQKNGNRISFFLAHAHCLPVSVDANTFQRIRKAVANYSEPEEILGELP
ncbi:hypothetical protein [Acinetobacter sp. ANC 3791]|uniref:hypothetical protein n=1 Tax=Acinetobacter sp. ANC 3791 TaxID=2529836 RepID=UPI001038C01E|nr:hypothetical protein [Acinetobacter sp. ANC 3791]TCB83355.1 hypothetical protein E0H90_11540 [Acinetobacter sp. ANC 3791]